MLVRVLLMLETLCLVTLGSLSLRAILSPVSRLVKMVTLNLP